MQRGVHSLHGTDQGQVTEVASQTCLPPSGFTGNPVEKIFPHFNSQLELGYLGEHL